MSETSFHDWASAALPAGDVDYPALAVAAGGTGEPGAVRIDGERFYVDGISQVQLDAAVAAYDPTKIKPTVPQSVTRAQAKIALYKSGHLDMVKTAVGADPVTQIWFDEAMTWERQNPYIIDIGEKLLGGSDEVDALFIAAAQISA